MTAKKTNNAAMVKRLAQLMRKSGVNARELAERANLGPSFVYDILRGKSENPTARKLSLVAAALGVKPGYLMHGAAENGGGLDGALAGIAAISGLGVTEKGGKRAVCDSMEAGGIYFRESWIAEFLQANPANLRMLKIEGDNMFPTLSEGDTVLVNLARKSPSPPGIFILFDGMGLVAKRLEYNPETAMARVISDNRKYAAYEVKIGEIEVIGRVVWLGREAKTL